MIGKVKDLMRSGEGIEQINKQIAEQKREMQELKDTISDMKKEIRSSIKEMTKLAELNLKIKENNEECAYELSKDSKELRSAVDDFKVMKSRMQNKVFDEISRSFKSKLDDEIEKIRRDMNDFALAKENVERVLGEVSKLSMKIEEFNAVAQNIKQEDFELSKFANKIFAEDKNKLELMKRIDNLEKLIAKQRRNKNMSHSSYR